MRSVQTLLYVCLALLLLPSWAVATALALFEDKPDQASDLVWVSPVSYARCALELCDWLLVVMNSTLWGVISFAAIIINKTLA